jgi:hypothetical protein
MGNGSSPDNSVTVPPALRKNSFAPGDLRGMRRLLGWKTGLDSSFPRSAWEGGKLPKEKAHSPFVLPSGWGLLRNGRTSLPRLATRSSDTTPCGAGTCWVSEGSLPRCHALQGWQRGPDRPGQTAPEQRACPGRFRLRRARKDGTHYLLPPLRVGTRNLPKEKRTPSPPGGDASGRATVSKRCYRRRREGQRVPTLPGPPIANGLIGQRAGGFILPGLSPGQARRLAVALRHR